MARVRGVSRAALVGQGRRQVQKKGVFGRGQVVWKRETAFSTLEKNTSILGHFPFFRAMTATQSVAAIARKNGKCPRGKKEKKKKLSISAYLYRVVLGAFVIPRAGRNKRVNDREKKWGPSSFLLLPSFPLLFACGARVFTRGSTSVGPCTQGVFTGGGHNRRKRALLSAICVCVDRG